MIFLVSHKYSVEHSRPLSHSENRITGSASAKISENSY